MDEADRFLRAVRQPERLGDGDMRACSAALSARASGEATREALRTVLAILYARPDLLEAALIDRLRNLMSQPDQPESTALLLYDVVRALVSTCLGGLMVGVITDLLAQPALPTASQTALLEALEYVVLWRRDLLDVETLISLLERGHSESCRRRMLTQVIEPCLLAHADAVDDALLCRYRRLCAVNADAPYGLALIASRHDVCEPVRRIARDAIQGSFPLADQVGERLRHGAKYILGVDNVDDAQGDALIRVVPLLQALLDCNPASRITLLTSRRYLFSHPRLTSVAIDHAPAVHAAMGERSDILIDWFNPAVNHGTGLEWAVLAHIRTHRPFLSLGSGNSDGSNVYDRVDLDGYPWAKRLGLDQQRGSNVWEPSFRLLTELGLSARTGESAPETPILGGVPCLEERALWDETVRANVEGRPVALLNPFGGHEALKGYVARTMPQLLRRVHALMAEGFFVVILPSAMPWGAASIVRSLLERVPEEERRYVAAGPDPRERGGSAACTCSGSALPYHSAVMRHCIGFVRRAHLIVAVEGWTIHVAYVLGKPYRVLTMPYSLPEPHGWLPYGSTQHQLVAEPAEMVDTSGLADVAAIPPLEEQPRMLTLRALLRELGASARSDALPPLLRGMQSEDRQVRLEVVRALGPFAGETIYPLLLALIDDPCCEVRAVAAKMLLDSGLDWSHALGPTFAEQLRAHVVIGEMSSDWGRLLMGGPGARIALERAVRDDYASVRSYATDTLRLLDFYRNSSVPPSRGLFGRRWWHGFRRTVATSDVSASHLDLPSILILTPLKDAEDCIERYCSMLSGLSYPHGRVSVAFLEGDSTDRTFSAIQSALPRLRRTFRQVGLWKHDFQYQIPEGHVRGDVAIQLERRSVLARSRNELLARALQDEDWVLWLDVDVDEYQPDILERLLAPGKDILTPHCVVHYGSRSFDRNSWRDRGALYLEDLRDEGEVVPLHGVGATMLLVRAELHRAGLHFPPCLYGMGNALCRDPEGEIETEGLAIMAHDMGYHCWGMPRLEIRHRDR